jgi:exonuclease SbcC
MFVREVTLQNIKSYKNATVLFERGLTAIVGPNGSGKSTILEAIGYGLFGYMPHRPQVAFMRHGATEATVTVEFISPSDGRPYRVERTMRRSRSRSTGTVSANTTTTVSLFDIELARSIDQPAAELEQWLALQLGVDGLNGPAEVFEHVIGVPQGRLTSDFLDSARLRKERFDPILRTSEFQQAVDRLRPLAQHYRDRRSELESSAANLEGQLAAEPQMHARLSDAKRLLRETRATHTEAKAELQALTATLATYQTHHKLLEKAELALAMALQRKDQAQTELESANAAARTSDEAAQIIDASRNGYLAHREAQQHIETLDAIEDQALTLARNKDRKALVLEQATEDLAGTRRLVGPTVKATAPSDTSVNTEPLFQELRDRFQEIASELQEKEITARASLVQANEDVRTAQRNAQREQSGAVVSCEEQRQKLVALQTQISIATELPERQATLDTLRREQTRVTALMESDRHAQDLLLASGTCPFLDSSCLNLEYVPDVSSVFAARARTHKTHLASVEPELNQAEASLNEAMVAEQESHQASLIEERIAELEGAIASADAAMLVARNISKSISTANIDTLAEIAASSENDQASISNAATLAQIATRAAQALATLATPHENSTAVISAKFLGVSIHRKSMARAQLKETDQKLKLLSEPLKTLAGARTTVEKTTNAHAEYLRNETLAEFRKARRNDLAQAQQTAVDTDADATTARDSVGVARTQYDPTTHANARQSRDTALGRSEQLGERFVRYQADADQLSADLDSLQLVRSEIEEVQAEITRVTQLEDRAEFIRSILREAGPHVTATMLSGISDTADEIYGDIIGSRAGRLQWAADYDIVLDHMNAERHFAQFSGGEQMSAALAVRLALLRDLLNLDIAFFDEPTQHLDAIRRENLAQQILAVRGFTQLVIISHDDTFERHIDNVLRVANINGTSVIEVV